MLFKDRIAIVTGAAQGLGLAYADALLREGARVVMADPGVDRQGQGADPERVVQAARGLGADASQRLAWGDRLDRESDVTALVQATVAHFGGLDILIHNAGWVGYEPIAATDDAFVERMLDVNVRAPIWLAKHAWPHLQRSSSPRIVLTTSDRAMYTCHAQAGLVAYAAGKMAQLGIMNALSAEGRDHGILVNAISPVAKTRMWGVEEAPDELKPAWVAPGVLYLASSACTDTGVILRASNGQFTATRFNEHPQVRYPRDLRQVACATVQDVAQQWDRIMAPARA